VSRSVGARDRSRWTGPVGVLVLLVVPLSVQVYPDSTSAVFLWGLANLDPPSVTPLTAFLFRYTAGLPGYITAWPLAVALWVMALLSTLVGAVTGREDPRITAGLLVLAGATAVPVSTGFAVQPGRVAYPVGTLALWGVAAWYWGRQ
jgi:uncharacterized protein (TIGR04206 family)